MEENTVNVNAAPAPETNTDTAGFEPANVFAFAPEEESNPVDAGTEEPKVTQEEPAETDVAESGGGVVGHEQAEQRDVGRAFAEERRRQQARYQREYEEKLKTDPTYLAGKRVIEDIMHREGKTYDEAAQLAEERWITAVAKRENVSPMILKMMLQNQQQQAKTDNEPDFDARASDIVTELLQTKLPEGFDLDAAMKDEDFLSLLSELPPAAAIRVYRAEAKAANAPKAIAEQLRARQQIPQSTRPQQAATPVIDFQTMPDSEFWAFKERLRKSR